ncbi:MAG TPA: S8 family serine peptidase [Candidatus Dormibacteraeota bacterium]
MRPAWSWQFEPDALGPVGATLPAALTREWAFAGATGAGVRVGVVDSGIDAAHPAVRGVAGGVVVERDDGAATGVRFVEGAHEDLFGHGTACAGIIRRAAPQCELYSIRVLGERLTGKGMVFAAGLRWALEHGMQVVNLSLSTAKADYFALFHELADEAYFKNVMLVCAVNNVPGPTYPSQYSSVFSVAARAGDDPLRFAYNPAPPVEFGAPGIEVEVAWRGEATMRVTGNSFAAPHISGIIARILSKHPGLTPFQMKTVLVALADNHPDRAKTGPGRHRPGPGQES